MNDAAANALLKLLEEPPPRAMLLLLAHAPARLLPTIRSRCQRLELRPLDDAALEAELAQRLPDMSAAERASLAKLAGGSIGAALRLASDDGLMLATEAENLIDRAATPDFSATLALADKIARIDDGTEMFGHFLLDALAARIRAARPGRRAIARPLGRAVGTAGKELRPDGGVASGAAPDDPVGRAGARAARNAVIPSTVSFDARRQPLPSRFSRLRRSGA